MDENRPCSRALPERNTYTHVYRKVTRVFVDKMKGSCEVDMDITSTDVMKHHVTTEPHDPTPLRAKTLRTNGTFVLAVSVMIGLMTCMFVLVNRNEQNCRIALLETEIRNHQNLIRELQEYIKVFGGNPGAGDYLDTTVASEGRKEDAAVLPEQSEVIGDVIKNIQYDKQSISRPGNTGNPDLRRTNLYRSENTESEFGRRLKRTVVTTPAPSQKRKKGTKHGRPPRVSGNNRGPLTCDFVNQCNGTMGRHGGNTLVAHFELDNDSDHLVSDEIIGMWNRATWMSHHVGFRFRSSGRSRNAKIQVNEPGIYYVYSQVTFADSGSYLAYSIMLEDVPKFTCRLFVTENVVDSNACMTGGLLHITRGQKIHIELAERNKIISMDKESTFFGMIKMLDL